MFERLTADELTTIAQHARERVFPKGSRLIEPGTMTTAAHVVLEGRVLVKREHGQEVVGPNESVGFVDLLAHAATDLAATAEVNTQTLELDWEAQLDICEQYFTIFLQYIRYLCERCISERPLHASRTASARDQSRTALHRPLNIVERALAFRQSTVFAFCGADALWELVRHVEEVKFAAGEKVWDIGDSAHSFLLTLDGAVQCEDATGAVRTVSPHGTLGMFESMSTHQRWYRAAAVEPTTALSLDDNSFLDILEDHFEMAIEYTAAIARTLLAVGESADAHTL